MSDTIHIEQPPTNFIQQAFESFPENSVTEVQCAGQIQVQNISTGKSSEVLPCPAHCQWTKSPEYNVPFLDDEK